MQDVNQFLFVKIDFGWYIIGLLLIFTSLLLAILPMLKKSKIQTPQENAKQNLKQIDFENETPKEIAYKFSLNANLLKNERNIKKLLEIEEKLEVYKYKKETHMAFDKNLQNEIIWFAKEMI